MTPYRRNVLVGATVVLAMCILGWMILKFADRAAPFFAAPTFTVRFITDRADGVGEGSPIVYRGVEAGHVTRIWLDETTRDRVHFEGQINSTPTLPGNVTARIRTTSPLGSGSTISLESVGVPSSDPLKEGKEINAEYVGLGEYLPTQQIADLATELTRVTKQLREANLIGHLDEQVQNAGKAIDSIKSLVEDGKLRGDITKSLDNIRDASERAKSITAKIDAFSTDLQKMSNSATATINDTHAQVLKAGNNIDNLSKQMGDRLTQVAAMLTQVQQISEKINDGKGTAGLLVNDNRLYESLVDTSKELNATVKDLKRLVEQWEQEGVSLKLR